LKSSGCSNDAADLDHEHDGITHHLLWIQFDKSLQTARRTIFHSQTGFLPGFFGECPIGPLLIRKQADFCVLAIAESLKGSARRHE